MKIPSAPHRLTTLSEARLSGWTLPALVLIAAALLTRMWVFGNPVVHIDEQFYLMVGTRMLDGAMPFVDIWDRKPFGLFLLYALFAALAPDPVWGYQIAALLSVVLTALVIHRTALRFAPPAGALVAAVAYIVYLPVLGGVGGQSPVFYNLLVALAGMLTLRTVATPEPRARHLGPAGLAVMLLLGIAIQIKYTVIFEGMFFGLALLWRGWSDRRSPFVLALFSLTWVVAALLPTALALLYYIGIEYGDLFIQANFLSIFGRYQAKLPALARLLLHIVLLAPLWLPIRHLWKTAPANPALCFVRLWAIVAALGYLIFGSYYIHYALPLLVPMTIAAAPALGWATDIAWRRSLLATVPAFLLSLGAVALDLHLLGNAADVRRAVDLIQPRLNDGCLYVYEGDPILYERTHACMLTRFVFPSHLNNRKEKDALGIDVNAEIRRVLDARPTVIVMRRTARAGLTNTETRAILIDTLRRHYRFVGDAPSGTQPWMIFALRDGHAAPPSPVFKMVR